MKKPTEKVSITTISEGDKVIINTEPRKVNEITNPQDSIIVLYLDPLGSGQTPTPYSFDENDTIKKVIGD